MNDTVTSLRDRKRLETRARLERAAVTLVLEQGLERTTVDQISAAANVSPRTFFNYFDTKEDALLGLHDTEANDDLIVEEVAVARGAHGPQLARFVIHLMVSVLGPRLASADARHDRKIILERYPHLMSRVFAQMSRTTETLADAVRRVTEEWPHDPSPWPELVIALCGTSVRETLNAWVAADSGSLDDLEERALALVIATLEKLK